MIKTGIYNLNQIKENSNFKGIFGGNRKVSITLYDQIINQPNGTVLAEKLLLFFSDPRGAFKWTSENRFENFDSQVIKIIQNYFRETEEVTIQDMGISDGRTAVDFFNNLISFFPKINYDASDYDPFLFILESGKTKITLSYLDKILEIVWPPFVFNTIKPDSIKYYPINNLVRMLVDKYVVPPIIKKFKNGRLIKKELTIFAPKALNLAISDNRFSLLQHDLLIPCKKKSQIIRAMNVLNFSYFTESEFECIINNINLGLNEGGLFITGSNQEAGTIVHGGIYQKQNQRFKKVWQSGDGSPIEKIILNHNTC